MRLTSTGLGIGTSSPATKLQVNGGYISQSDGTVTTYMGSDGTGSLFGTTTNQYLRFITNNTERMRLDSSGNLGLGVTPSAWVGYKVLQAGIGSFIGGSSGAYLLQDNAYTDNSGAGWKYINSSYAAAQYYAASGAHVWRTAPSGTAGNAITFTQAMTLDASGNLNVGYTSSYSPTGGGTTKGTFGNDANSRTNLVVSNQSSGSSASAALVLGAYGADWIIGAGSVANTNTSLTFTRGSSEFARIDSSGNLLVGTTSALSVASKVQVSSAASVAYFYTSSTGSDGCYVDIAGNNKFFEFRKAGVEKGNISFNGTLTVYNTTSDYRLKNVTNSVTGHGERIDALKPVDYEWKEDNSQARGFLAHEFQEVYPNSVTGIKDAVDKNGNPKYQSMQASTPEVIADLVAEIQSLRKRLADAGIA
jgi:hypothetical protein